MKIIHLNILFVLILATLTSCKPPSGSNNTTPVADAGIDQNVVADETVQLDGSGSRDADGDELTYLWSITSSPDGSSATLSSPSIVNPTLSPDIEGEYEIQLIVNDGLVDSESDLVSITVEVSEPSWERFQLSTTEDLMDVWGTDGDNVYVVGGDYYEYDTDLGTPVMFHFDGESWSSLTGHNAGGAITAIVGISNTEIYLSTAVGELILYDGSTFSQLATTPSSAYIRCMWGAGSGDIYLGGVGTIYHYDGNNISTVYSDESGHTLRNMHGFSSDSIYAVRNDCRLIYYDGTTWEIVGSINDEDIWFNAIWGNRKDDIFVAGGDGIVYQWDDTDLTLMSNTRGELGDIDGMWGTSSGTVYTVGSTVYKYSDGVSWSEEPDLYTHEWYHGIWGTSDGSDIFAVGDGGWTLHYGD